MASPRSFSFRQSLRFKSLSFSAASDKSATLLPATEAVQISSGLNRLDEPTEPLDSRLSSSSTLHAEHNVDIIALHGLGGHGFNTFRHPNETMWLKDLLPKDVPGARIYTYSYDSAVAFSRNTETIRDYGRRLLENLRLIRSTKEEQDRPIIFICHSMGGIVTKQAIITSHNEANLYPNIFNKIAGILFLACPHQGSSTADYGKALARIVNAALISTQASRIKGTLRSDLLKSLQRNSSELLRVAEEFRVHTGCMQISSFVEKKKMKGLNQRVVDDAGSFLGAANDVRIPMEGYDHREIVRFESQNDTGYQLVLGRVKSAIQSANEKTSPAFEASKKMSRVVRVPFKPNASFVGRSDIVNAIHLTLHDADRDHKVAVYGLGGIGKTQILLNYAHQIISEEPDTSVFWVFGGNPSRFASDYAEIARALNLSGHDNPEADILQMVKDALESDNYGRWLLILDNIDDRDAFFKPPPAHLEGNAMKIQRSLASYVPENAIGSILYSTRDKACAVEITEQGKIILVDKLSNEDGKLLLSKKLDEKISDDPAWDELLEEVEHLPLAIVQAASYIRQKSLSVARYLTNYREMSTQLLNHEFREKAREEGVTNAVLKTWLITFEQIQKQDSRAADIFCTMSFFHRQDIPQYLLRGEDESQAVFDDAMGTLMAYSLVTTFNDLQSFSVHNLVQLSARLWVDDKNQIVNFAGLALSSLAKYYPEDFQFQIKDKKWESQSSAKGHQEREICGLLLPHVDPVLRSNTPSVDNISHYQRLLQNCHVYLRKRQQYRLAEFYISTLAEAMKSVLLPNDPRTIHALGELGYLHYCQGNPAASEAVIRQAMQMYDSADPTPPIKVHEDLCRKLAWASQEQQKYAAAESLHRTVLARRQQALGPAHPATLDSLDDLGYTLSRAGSPAAARATLELAVAGRARVLGPDHPKTLRSVNRLAGALRAQGDWPAAEAMLRRVVAGTEAALGAGMGGTVRAKGQLAVTLERQGKMDEAEGVWREVVRVGEEAGQKDDLGFLRSCVQLAELLRGRKKFGEAARYFAMGKEGYEMRGQKEEEQRCATMWKNTVEEMNNEDGTSSEGEYETIHTPTSSVDSMV